MQVIKSDYLQLHTYIHVMELELLNIPLIEEYNNNKRFRCECL